MSPDVLKEVHKHRDELLEQKTGLTTVVINVTESRRGGARRGGAPVLLNSRSYKIVEDRDGTQKWWKMCCFKGCDVELLNSDRLVQSQETATQETEDEEDEDEEASDDEYEEKDESTTSSESSDDY